jgi:hypothetical protein
MRVLCLNLLTAGALLLSLVYPMKGVRAFPDNSYALATSHDGYEVRTPEGRVVFEYVTQKLTNIGLTAPSASYFHPVETPSGETVTNVAPDDHPHHRGIFLGFLNSEFHIPVHQSLNSRDLPSGTFDIQRADYWAWGFFAPRENRVIQNRDVHLIDADSKHAELEIRNDWLVEGKKMLEETDRVNVSERDGVYVIDLAYRLAPLYDYVIHQTAFGGFAVQGMKYGDSYYSAPWGKVTLTPPYYSNPESDWPSEPWYDYTVRLKSDGKTVGVAVLDHPLNPPTRWHNTVWLLNPCISSYRPVTIHPGTPLILRYRVVVHDGPPPTKVLQDLSEEWGGMQGDPFVAN